jgi:cytochrome c oxidase subunit 4
MSEQTMQQPVAPTDGMPIATPAADEHTHGGVHDPNLHHSPEEIKREVRVYLLVFGSLAVLTGATVAARYLFDLPMGYAITVALIIAAIKASLVACFFMHLLSEKKLIYAVLTLTAIFFAFLIWLPVHDMIDKMGK